MKPNSSTSAHHSRRRAILAGVTALATAIVASMTGAPVATAATVNIDLCATTGTATLPNATPSGATTTTVNIWGYVAGDCTTGSGTAVLGGAPTITAVEGDVVNVTLHNDLAQATSLTFQGQSLPTDRTGAVPTGTRSYSFTASEPGTFLYEAGMTSNSVNQVGMGMYGVLVVQPSAAPAYDTEAIVLISEVDPALNAAPTTFDMRKFATKYTLINGKPFPQTGTLTSVAAGDSLLLRYVNAGISYHSMSLLGANQRIVADDGHALNYPYTVVAQTVGPGQTFDAIVDVPLSTADGTKLTIFDGNLQLRNRNRRPAATATYKAYGGAITFIAVTNTPGTGDTSGPLASGLVATTTSIDANISDLTTGNNNVTAAEYFIDATGAPGSGAQFPSFTASPTVAVSDTFSALSSGTHSIYVRGQDSEGNWGPLASTTVTSDTAGPASSGLSLTPNPTDGTVSVALHATGSDAATGGATIAAAEYFIDGPVVDGTGTPMTVSSPPVVTASLNAVIAAATVGALSEGPHTIRVHAKDSVSPVGNWGPATSIVLTVDTTGPTIPASPAAGSVIATPNPTNGAIGVNSSTPAVRITATATDTAATIVRAEAFIDTVGTPGTGIPFVPADGAWTSLTEAIRTDIPLATINALGNGPHTVHVRAKDATGNWGALATVTLTVDKTVPLLSGLAVTNGPGSQTVTVSVDATDVFSSVNRVEYFIGADPGRGLATALTAGIAPSYSAAISTITLPEGNSTVTVRARDAAGNWSTLTSTTFSVVRDLYFSTAGGTNPPSVPGTADDADIYRWNGAFSRSIDVTTIINPLPGGANVDGFARVSATQFYMSFNGTVTIVLPGPDLTVQDEDVVFYNAGTWSVYFDGTPVARGLSGSDLDAISIVGSTLYFSTDDTDVPAGVSGGGDDADIYSWNGSTFARVSDASALGWSTANVDGFVWVDATHSYISYSTDTTVPVLGAVQDEDVVYRNGTTWSVWFDGTGKGLTNANHDLDAIDVP